jgi:ORF6N domain
MNTEIQLSEELISNKIYYIRNQKVILDTDLALLYGLETKRLKEQVKRNLQRFPDDFMFELTKQEFENCRSQFVTSNSEKMGLRYATMAFKENMSDSKMNFIYHKFHKLSQINL